MATKKPSMKIEEIIGELDPCSCHNAAYIRTVLVIDRERGLYKCPRCGGYIYSGPLYEPYISKSVQRRMNVIKNSKKEPKLKTENTNKSKTEKKKEPKLKTEKGN